MRKVLAAQRQCLLLLLSQISTVGMQGVWWDDSSLLMLPHMDRAAMQALAARRLEALPQLLMESRQHPQRTQKLLEQALGDARRAQECQQVTDNKPAMHSTRICWTGPASRRRFPSLQCI